MAINEKKKMKFTLVVCHVFGHTDFQMRSSVEVSVLVGYDATSPDQGSKGLKIQTSALSRNVGNGLPSNVSYRRRMKTSAISLQKKKLNLQVLCRTQL